MRTMHPAVGSTTPACALVNQLKYWAGRFEAGRPRHLQSHAAFAFLLDYVPEWRRAYGRGGLIQYQSFVPADARAVHRELLERSQRAGDAVSLVYKRHRPTRGSDARGRRLLDGDGLQGHRSQP